MQASVNKTVKKSFGISHLLGLSDDDEKLERVEEKEHKPHEVKVISKTGARKRKRKKEESEEKTKIAWNFQTEPLDSVFKTSIPYPFHARSYPDCNKRFKQDSKSYNQSNRPHFNPYSVQNNQIFSHQKLPPMWTSPGKVTPSYSDTMPSPLSRYQQNIPLTYLSMWQQNLLAAVKSRFTCNQEVPDSLENPLHSGSTFSLYRDPKHLVGGLSGYQQHRGALYVYGDHHHHHHHHHQQQQHLQQQQQQHKGIYSDNLTTAHRWTTDNMNIDNGGNDYNEYNNISKNSTDDVTKRFQSPSHFGESMFQSNFHFQNSNSVDALMDGQSFHEDVDNSG